MPRDITEFFEQYRDAFNRLDGDAIANLYCVPSGIASDRGLTTWQSREPIAENMVALCALYRANGYKQAHFQPNHFISQGADFAVADVEWTIEREAKLTRGDSTPRTIFVAPLKVGVLCCVPRMKRSASTPNRAVNTDAHRRRFRLGGRRLP